MKTIPIAEVEIEDRIRRTFDQTKLANLSDSIARLGLLHAPILRDGKLVCGERRIRAIKLLPTFGHKLFYQGVEVPAGHIPYTELGSSTELQIMEAELEENLMRDDLSVQEEAAARTDLHRLRVAQNPGHTKLDTARELSKPGAKLASMDIRNAILITEHSHVPEVAKAKTAKEAMKVITKLKRAEHNAGLAEEFKRDPESPHQLIQGDCIEWLELAALEEEPSVDVICTDPPYGVDAQNFNAQEGISHDYNDTRENFERIIRAIATSGAAICKAGAHAYIFHDFANWSFIRETMEGAGWQVWPRPLIWSKGNGLLARPDHGPRYTYECILYAMRGNRKVTLVAPDVINFRTLTRQRRGAEKPAGLYHDLLARSVQPGDTVLDPCCGLGPIFPAANELSVRAIGVELDPSAIGYATTRLKLNLAEDAERREQEEAEDE
jgi:DNA modification methylase/ParB-like chromosome segregation protein Spo0J